MQILNYLSYLTPKYFLNDYMNLKIDKVMKNKI